MKKVIGSILLICAGVAYATTENTASAPTKVVPASCKPLHQQMKENHQQMEEAYQTNDACTLGKLMISNRNLFENNPQCFPNYEEIHKRIHTN